MSDSAPILAIVSACSTLPIGVIDSACRELERLSDDAPSAKIEAVCLCTGSIDARQTLGRMLVSCTEGVRRLSPREIAAALRAAAGMDKYHRRRQSVELIWTGPSSTVETLRRTEQALIELIESARHQLWLLTFVAYKAEGVMRALADASARGVAIRILAESEESSDGKTVFGAADALRTVLKAAATIYVWPSEERHRDGSGQAGTLHAKGALADASSLLITSANLTDHALRLNIELGVVINGGDLPRQVGAHLDDLVCRGILRRM